MNDISEFLNKNGCGDLLLIALGFGAFGLAYYKYLQIKSIRQQITLNQCELDEKKNESK